MKKIINVDLNNIESIKKAEKKKSMLENKGYYLYCEYGTDSNYFMVYKSI